MNYIGSKVNSPSYKVWRKGKDVDVSIDYFFKTPTGILIKDLLKKSYGSNLDTGLSSIYKYDDMEGTVNSLDLTSHEKRKLIEALHKYDVYLAQLALQYSKQRRKSDLEHSEYQVDEYSNRGYKYTQLPEEGFRYGSSTPLDTLELERKKKSSKAKPKRKPVKKPVKKVVKKCKCKK